MAAGHDPKRRELDEFCVNYTVFIGALCLIAAFLFGWPVVITWIFFRSGMRLFHDVLTDSSPSTRTSHQQQRRCRD